MHVKNTQLKRKFREILATRKLSENNSFEEIKKELSLDSRIRTKEERNIIAGLISKRLKRKK
jgi:ribosomal protein S17E